MEVLSSRTSMHSCKCSGARVFEKGGGCDDHDAGCNAPAVVACRDVRTADRRDLPLKKKSEEESQGEGGALAAKAVGTHGVKGGVAR